MKDWAGKIAGTTLRIAALLCLAEAGPDGRVCTGPWAELPHYEITEEQLYRAMTISTYFIEHAKAAYSRIGAEGVTEFSRRTLAWIRKKEKREVSLREIQRACTYLQNASEVQAVLDRLEECGYLLVKDPEQRHRTGRPANPVYAVNPLLYGKKLPARKQ